MFKWLNISSDKPYFTYKGQKVFAIYDGPHLLKSVRNALFKKDITTEYGRASWRCVTELYNLEKTATTKMVPKLTYKHAYPNPWQKMKVSLAVQVFSHTCDVVALYKLQVNLICFRRN